MGNKKEEKASGIHVQPVPKDNKKEKDINGWIAAQDPRDLLDVYKKLRVKENKNADEEYMSKQLNWALVKRYDILTYKHSVGTGRALENAEVHELLDLGRFFRQNPQEVMKACDHESFNLSTLRSNAFDDFSIPLIFKSYKKEVKNHPMHFDTEEQLIAHCREQVSNHKTFDLLCPETNKRYFSDGNQFVHGTREDVELFRQDPDQYMVNMDGEISKNVDQDNAIKSKL